MSVTKYGQSECNVLWSKCNVLNEINEKDYGLKEARWNMII